MKFLENLSEFTGGARGGLGALGDVLAAAAMGEANARPGEGTGGGAARGFAMGVGGLSDSFARGRASRDKDRVRIMAAEKLKDPNIGQAERDLWTAVASGNTAALELFDESLAARGSDRADKTAQAQMDYYGAKKAAAGAAKALTNDEIRHNKNVLEARKRLMENPTLFDQLDMGDPDSLTGKAMDTYKGVPDPEHGAIHRWLSTDSLMREGLPALMGEIEGEYGAEGLSMFAGRYGLGGAPAGAPETGGQAAELADGAQGGGAGGLVDTISGVGARATGSGLASNLRGIIDSAFGTDFSAQDRKRVGARGEMDSLLGELDAAARGQSAPTAPRITGGGVLVPDDQIDRAFNAITGGGAGAAERPAGPDLLRREDELRRSTGPTSRFDQFVSQAFPGMAPEQIMMQNPTLPIRAGMEFDRNMAKVPGQLRGARSDFSHALSTFPDDFMQSVRSAARGNYAPVQVDAYGAGQKARADFARAAEPFTSRMAPYADLSPTLQQEREDFLRALGWNN